MTALVRLWLTMCLRVLGTHAFARLAPKLFKIELSIFNQAHAMQSPSTRRPHQREELQGRCHTLLRAMDTSVGGIPGSWHVRKVRRPAWLCPAPARTRGSLGASCTMIDWSLHCQAQLTTCTFSGWCGRMEPCGPNHERRQCRCLTFAGLNQGGLYTAFPQKLEQSRT